MGDKTEITKKGLSFISDPDLRIILLDRLHELDRVVEVNANLSTVFLSISTIEGVFKHLSGIFKSKMQTSPTYPVDLTGKPKDFDKLTVDELYLLLQGQSILPSVTNFENVYHLFRDYRNFIHPQAQARKDWPAGLGQAQMALGLLNSTIDHLSRFIFIDQFLFENIAGRPDYNISRILDLPTAETYVNSFIVLTDLISDRLLLEFDAELPPDSILNFVFNFKDDSNFKMIRLDKRADPQLQNSLLYCNQKYSWHQVYFADYPHPPEKAVIPIVIEIEKSSKKFEFKVDSVAYSFKDRAGNLVNLFDEFASGLRVGLFNEVRPVKLSNIKIAK